MTLPAGIRRCPGVGSDSEGWREGCDLCLRRTSQPADPTRAWQITPPAVIVFECEDLIEGRP